MAKVRSFDELAKIIGERGRECCDAGARPHEMLRPSRRRRAAADDDSGLAVKLKKNRQMAHGSRNAKRHCAI